MIIPKNDDFVEYLSSKRIRRQLWFYIRHFEGPQKVRFIFQTFRFVYATNINHAKAPQIPELRV